MKGKSMERTKNGSLGRSVSIIGIGATPCGNVAKDEPIKDLTEAIDRFMK